MGITRRQFLFSIPAVGAGFILPSFFDRAVDVLARTGEPLIIPPEECVTALFAVKRDEGDFQLNIGDPCEGPPSMTLREFAKCRGEDIEMYLEEDPNADPDAEVDEWDAFDAWFLNDSPNARAWHQLHGLDLGPELSGPGAAGEIRFIEGWSPGSDYLGVHAADVLTLSLLQERLNQLKTGLHIRVY